MLPAAPSSKYSLPAMGLVDFVLLGLVPFAPLLEANPGYYDKLKIHHMNLLAGLNETAALLDLCQRQIVGNN